MVLSSTILSEIHHCFLFLMDEELDTPYFTEFALFMGRGAGKMAS